MFPKNQRITKKSDFNLIYKKGRVFYSENLSLRILKKNSNINRFAVIVSKKVSNKATKRNKLKRRLRELLKKYENRLPKGVDMVIYTKKELLELNFKELEKNIKKILTKIKI